MHLEIEQKFPVEDEVQFQARTRRLSLELSAPVRQVDEYFRHPSRDFAQTDEALRIRRVGQQNFVTYKGPKLDAETKTRRELELPIAAGDAGYRSFAELLSALGFSAVAKVEKERRIARLVIDGFPAEIALDAVAGVGTYVEIEITADEARQAPAKAALLKLATELGLSGSERRSYLELLLARGATRPG